MKPFKKRSIYDLSMPLTVLRRLCKLYPNDADLGKQIRKDINQAIKYLTND